MLVILLPIFHFQLAGRSIIRKDTRHYLLISIVWNGLEEGLMIFILRITFVHNG